MMWVACHDNFVEGGRGLSDGSSLVVLLSRIRITPLLIENWPLRFGWFVCDYIKTYFGYVTQPYGFKYEF